MEMIDILLLVIGWLLISCAIARVFGGACDIGGTPVERWNDLNVVSNPSSTAGEDGCLGLVLERVALPSTKYISALFSSVWGHGKSAIAPARLFPTSSLQAMPEPLAALDPCLTSAP